MSHYNGKDVTILIEMHLLDTSDAIIAFIRIDRTTVVDNIVFIAALIINDRVVACSASNLIVLLQDNTATLTYQCDVKRSSKQE